MTVELILEAAALSSVHVLSTSVSEESECSNNTSFSPLLLLSNELQGLATLLIVSVSLVAGGIVSKDWRNSRDFDKDCLNFEAIGDSESALGLMS